MCMFRKCLQQVSLEHSSNVIQARCATTAEQTFKSNIAETLESFPGVVNEHSCFLRSECSK